MFLRRAAVFVGVGVALYVGLYAWAEWLVYQRADRNRFFMVRTAPSRQYDHVILGASHAAVFDFGDMNRRLEERTGARILNLAVVGGGVAVNRLLLDYFLTAHQTGAIVQPGLLATSPRPSKLQKAMAMSDCRLTRKK